MSADASYPAADAPPVLAEIFASCEEDIGAFVAELADLDAQIGGNLDHVRDAMEADGLILGPAKDTDQPVDLHAVDGGLHQIPIGEVRTVVALAALCGPEGTVPRTRFFRCTGPNAELLGRAGGGIRTCIEAAMLADAPAVTIADGSFWSMLMEANQLITHLEDARSDAPRRLCDLYASAIEAPGGHVFRALTNTGVVAMSKVASSQAVSTKLYERFFRQPISDRLLFSRILRPGEFTAPRPLTDMTTGKFGVERRGWPASVQRALSESVFRGPLGLHVTFFRPSDVQPAYRIEFHRAGFPAGDDEAALGALFSAVARVTTNPLIREPEPQFLADAICRQAAAIGELYGTAHLHRFPNLLGPTRSSGYR